MAEVSAMLGALEPAVLRRLAALEDERMVAGVWSKDPTVWGGSAATPELGDRLGWLDLPDRMVSLLTGLEAFARERGHAVRHVVLCGMGGSSLAPDVLGSAFGTTAGAPRLRMLDSTHPESVAAVDRECDPSTTLYVIASKSGTTIETASFLEHYWHVTGGAGSQFVAITDPGTPLASLATERGFLRTFLAPPDVGGRFSALSPFGLVPAAIAGVPVRDVLTSARAMAAACRSPGERNPGAWLGAVLAEATLAGRDKLTLLEASGSGRLGLWAEQLVAESTGKEGKGIVPVVGEPLGPVRAYEKDRLFVRIGRQGVRDDRIDARLDQLAAAGHPVVQISLAGANELGGEFFRWEFATAVACAILGVNPFDQPNVAESKANTSAMLRQGYSPGPSDDAHALRRLFADARPGDYIALLAYLPDTPNHGARLAGLCAQLRDRYCLAVTAAYGPRYLHSTGQLHKGGPESGRFVYIVPRTGTDSPVPGQAYSFATLMGAQAEGDIAAVRARGRPVARVTTLDDLETVELL